MTTTEGLHDSVSDADRDASVKKIITDCGALMHGHFRLASGRHSDIYIEKFRILERPAVLEVVAKGIVEHFKNSHPDVIVGPSTGGIIVAYEVARQMGLPALYVELDEAGKRVVKRGARLEGGARVLLVDDVLTTGSSLFDVVKVLQEASAELVGVGVLIDRSGRPLDFGAELFASCHFEATTYAEDELPDWLAQIPLSTPGTRARLGSKV